MAHAATEYALQVTESTALLLRTSDRRASSSTIYRASSSWAGFWVFVACVVGQAMQNIGLPMALSEDHDDMSVTFIYTAFVYCLFFSLLDTCLDTCIPTPSIMHDIDQGALMYIGLQNALNGVGCIFGGTSSRTPLPIQACIQLIANLCAPFYKMWVFGVSFRNAVFTAFSHWYYPIAAILYSTAFGMTLVDKLSNVDTAGTLSPFGLFFVIGTAFGMTYNIHQERLVSNVNYSDMTLSQSFKCATHLLRKQTTWLFTFSWISVVFAAIPGVNERGPPTWHTFERAWSHFLPFGNMWMNIFNFGYILSFVSGVFMNKFDSSFNMLTTNLSAVLALWPGWVEVLRERTVGYTPSLPLTMVATGCALVAVWPSFLFSVQTRVLYECKKPSVPHGCVA